jgi:hypothetical protein
VRGGGVGDREGRERRRLRAGARRAGVAISRRYRGALEAGRKKTSKRTGKAAGGKGGDRDAGTRPFARFDAAREFESQSGRKQRESK